MELINDRIAVVRVPPNETSKGGIVLPDSFKMAEIASGIVAVVGPGEVLPSGERAPMHTKVGDRVVFMPRAGMTIPVKDGLNYKVFGEGEAWAILDHGNEVPEESYDPPG
ncbi:MAG TPA: co-chaperone GroES [Phycisphaerae bacterium]|nr:co-chaperone GroES [Phycisphaerae bacterium]HUU59202.1 co-chaperone GroES [Phycisphaerae bacterium]